MLRLTITGSFEGYEESKAYPGQNYIYVRPTATPPQGLLKSVRCPKQFGAPLEGTQELANFAILCGPADIPLVEIGTPISLATIAWPISKPVWSNRDNQIVWMKETTPLYTLDGKVTALDKPTNDAPRFEFTGTYQGGVRRDSAYTATRCMLAEAVPVELLRQVRVKKGLKGFISSQERLGAIFIQAHRTHIPALRPKTRITAKGTCWPISNPYYDPKTDSVAHQTIPTPIFTTTEPLKANGAK